MNQSRISIRAASAGLLIITAAFIPIKTEALEDYTSPRNATVDARGARTVTIEAAAGELRVEGQPGINEVRIRGTARSNRDSRLKDIKLIAERRGDVIYIKADIPDDNNWGSWNGGDRYMALDLIIEVPISLRLDVTDGSGDAEFKNTGSLDFEDGSGNILVRGAHGDVRIRDGSGNIIIEGVQGAVRVSDGSGEIRANDITGNFTVEEDGSGGIDVSGVGGTMRVENDGSGNIDVERVAGDFVVDSDGSGSIRYATVKGSVRIPERRHRRGY
ncbi:MAG: hypothetical protein ABI556_09215 [Gemmatimonadales bacterium]